jgi:hypothetical protein
MGETIAVSLRVPCRFCGGWSIPHRTGTTGLLQSRVDVLLLEEPQRGNVHMKDPFLALALLSLPTAAIASESHAHFAVPGKCVTLQ